jgi:glycosyltransferase involved in cell wall biosynthesis
MRVALLGTRGIPACYGGFETLAEELSARLAARGHRVTVYTRRHLAVPGLREHRGAAIRVLPAIRGKAIETLSHSALSCLVVSREEADVVLMCNAANAPLLPILRSRGLPVALNVDGLERKRRKWGLIGRSYYRMCEGLAARWADRVVTDAAVIARYYRRAWRRDSVMIPYGGDLPAPAGDDVLRRLGVEPMRYLLYVSRLEPENNPDRVIEAYRHVPGDLRLVLVGGAPYARELQAELRRLAAADARVLLAGAVYGDGYRQLLFNAAAYVHATEVGGTHPALVEAMGAGRVVLFLDNLENREVVRDAGVAFRFAPPYTLADALRDFVADPSRFAPLAGAARVRVERHYRWDDVTDAYESLLEELCSASPHG